MGDQTKIMQIHFCSELYKIINVLFWISLFFKAKVSFPWKCSQSQHCASLNGRFILETHNSSGRIIRLVGSLRNNDGDGNNNVAKQWYHWLKNHKQSCCTCSTDFSKYFWGPLHNNDVKSPNSRFWRQREHATVNLSFLSFHSEISRTNSFLGYFTDNVRREQDGIIAKDLW